MRRLNTFHPEEYARRLYVARQDRRPIRPITDDHSEVSVEDAYAIQTAFVDLMVKGGDAIAGYKLGLTSKPMQKLLGVGEPDYSAVMASQINSSPVVLQRSDFLQPKVEAEIALILKDDLYGPNVFPWHVACATSAVAIAIEIVDSRIENWRIKLVDTIADLASGGAIAVGAQVPWPSSVDLSRVGTTLYQNGEIVETSTGGATMGGPFVATAWLANALGRFGQSLSAGQLVMTGGLHRAVDTASGDVFSAECDGVGSVSLSIR